MKWINQNPGAHASERGYWQSECGRFDTSPRYRSTVYPDGYELRDARNPRKRFYSDTIRGAKAKAEDILRFEARERERVYAEIDKFQQAWW